MIVAIVGPTGVGKTKMSIELAKEYNAIIINFDSVQIYRGLNIGSAKITEPEKEGIEHYLLDIKNPDEDYSVKEYQDDLRQLLKKYSDRNIVLVGGTGLYLCAGLMDYRFEEESENKTFEDYSNEELYSMAIQRNKNLDVHPNNRKRLIRILNRKDITLVEPKCLYQDVHFIGLTTDRENLYKIIGQRFDKQLKDGLIDEVKDLYQRYPTSRVLHNAIGYKEIIDYLDGKISLDGASEIYKKNCRHYAKRQYTWFNNKMNVKWFTVNYDNFAETINIVKKYLNGVKK